MDNPQPSSNRIQDVLYKPFTTELQITPAQGRDNKPFSSSVTMALAHIYCKYWFRVDFSFQSLCVSTSAVWLRFGVKSDTPETLNPHQLLNKREQKQSTHCGNNINMTSSLYPLSYGRSCTCVFVVYCVWPLSSILNIFWN